MTRIFHTACLLLASLAGAIASHAADPAWELPGVRGTVPDGWAPGRNWTANPCADGGGMWTAYHEADARFVKMVSGRAYGFNFAMRDPGDSLAPRCMYMGKKLQPAPASTPGMPGPAALVAFTPPHRGSFKVSVLGTIDIKPGSPSLGRVVVGVFDATPALRRELAREDVNRGGTFAWDGSVALEEGESVGLALATLDAPTGPPGWPTFEFTHFTVVDTGSSRFAATLPAPAAEWKPRDAGVKVKPGPDGGMTLEIVAGTKDWCVLDGPSLAVPSRTRFNPDRSISVTAEAWPEKPGDTPIRGSSMHLRAKMNGGAVTVPSTSPGARTPASSYAQGISVRQIWDAVWELADADRMKSWTSAAGEGRIAPACDRLDFELWVAVPRSAPAVVHVRDFQVRENFSEAHLFTSEPAALGNIFFDDQGAMKIEFARGEELATWSVIDRDEADRVLHQLAGPAAPGVVTVPLVTRGLHRIEARAVYRDGATIVSRTTAATVGEPLADEIRLRSRFGVNRVHGDMPLWKKSGARWEWGIGKIRLADWVLEQDGAIRPPAGWRPLTPADGFTDLMSVGSLPSWLRRPGDTGDPRSIHPPNDWVLFEKLFEAFARANPDLPSFASIDNEVDAKWRGTAEEFIRWQALVARGARRGNPAMEVSGPGDYRIDLDVFRRYIQGGMFGATGLNGVNMHIYPGADPPEGELMDKVGGMCRMLAGAGLADLPVYLTEYGWYRGRNPLFNPLPDPADHPRYVARSLALLAACPVDAICWHAFRISGSRKAEDDLGYNLLHSDHTPSASYVAYVNAVKWLAEIKRGDARWFRFSPRVHLVLGRARGCIVGAAWCTQGEVPFELPERPLRAADMMGRTRALEQQLTLSPSPLFFELPSDNEFLDLPEKPALTIYPGQSIEIGLDRLAVAEGFATVGRRATAREAATPGSYLLVGHDPDTGQRVLQPLCIPPPLVLESLAEELSADCHGLAVVARVMPSIAGSVRASLTLSTGETSKAEGPAVAGEACSIRIAVPAFQPGRRIQGTLRVETDGEIPFSVSRDFDLTAMPAMTVEGRPDWSLIPAFDVTDQAALQEQAADDCSATVQVAAAGDGLHIRVTVKDDVHRQASPLHAIAQEDSVQFGIDVDAEKPWRSNLIMDGSFNGHRIFFYDVCKPADGRPALAWRSRADCPGFGSQCLASEVSADIRHEAGTTVYVVVLPWQSVDLEQAPPVGSRIGFSLAVNDADQGSDRAHLRFGGGLARPQDPMRFAALKIVEGRAGSAATSGVLPPAP